MIALIQSISTSFLARAITLLTLLTLALAPVTTAANPRMMTMMARQPKLNVFDDAKNKNNASTIHAHAAAATTTNTRRFLFYCRGHANSAADGYGCGGPCSIYYEGDPLDDFSIVCPGTNCVDTDGTWKFMVCDVAYTCSISKNFHPGIDTQGRYIWNTPGTSYIYPGVN
ncbi:hypothetical protein DV737_g4413, partial [Chaetothyriales sp. CBS 132003]